MGAAQVETPPVPSTWVEPSGPNRSALLQLGEVPDDGSPARLDLPMAKQSIEIIGMLQDKTRGNLTSAESQLLDTVLYDLRLRFLEESKKGRGGA